MPDNAFVSSIATKGIAGEIEARHVRNLTGLEGGGHDGGTGGEQ
jgi:hypothetical protein